jgi:hypothetical protein
MLNFEKSFKQLLISQFTLFHGVGFLVMTIYISVCFFSQLIINRMRWLEFSFLYLTHRLEDYYEHMYEPNLGNYLSQL